VLDWYHELWHIFNGPLSFSDVSSREPTTEANVNNCTE